MKTCAASLRRVSIAAGVSAVPAVALALTAPPAMAHGSMQSPVSRVLACYQQNPESPASAACKAAVSASGRQAFYDWNGVRLGEAAGRHRQIIPDGRLCSAGIPAFRGLDLPRADWPATRLQAGAARTLRYKVTAPHKGTFQLYITKNGYDPRKPLTWADLESKPFLTKSDPAAADGTYLLPGRLPAGKKGRHLIYAIWQRSDSPEAFYSCSDVVFGGKSTAGAAVPPKRAAANPSARPSKPAAKRQSAPPAKQPAPGVNAYTAPGHHHHGPSPAATVNSKPVAQKSTGDSFLAQRVALVIGVTGLALSGALGLLFARRRSARTAGWGR
ncbi:lytic polysaccharide monooxygenase auxiliary activity family 9 protein [Actinomadura bangladeshensis]|uniref:Lytic polysaccharide monooxygenase n=1 Tax=Actinomadura bangladeshensis TaxID=453573 RepID=A0A6L9QGZ1_9ACTN|nr:lytic polysaccharide monooxygenase [Actinomadura bangladeshensis]NEA24687.1 lytic polysaccharide monooxygenase [Actinomadura bangladeshensis]